MVAFKQVTNEWGTKIAFCRSPPRFAKGDFFIEGDDILENNRDFKGVWIPKEIWLDTRLTALDKIILIEIDSLSFEDKGCFASNEYLANFCQCSVTKVSLAISKLIEFDYIYLENFNGRQRELKSRLSKSERQTFKKCKADFQKMKDNNIVNNKDNNKIYIEKYKKEFETVWNEYPKKVGKEKSLKYYIKARQSGVEFETILDGIKRYKKQIELQETKRQFIKDGSTWFNNACWQDEYITESDNLGKNGYAGYDLNEYIRMIESEDS